MLEALPNTERVWKFERLEEGWMWVRVTAHGGMIAAGLFVNLAQCIRDARSFGFVEEKWERRKVPRIDQRQNEIHHPYTSKER